MLTVDYDELGLAPGDLVLDLGAGAGRHSYECFRRGARVVSLDYDYDELPEVGKLFWAMKEAGEAPADGLGACINGDALRLPFPIWPVRSSSPVLAPSPSTARTTTDACSTRCTRPRIVVILAPQGPSF